MSYLKKYFLFKPFSQQLLDRNLEVWNKNEQLSWPPGARFNFSRFFFSGGLLPNFLLKRTESWFISWYGIENIDVNTVQLQTQVVCL